MVARRTFSSRLLAVIAILLLCPTTSLSHGTMVYPPSRVRLIYDANPSNPSFPLAASAVAIDGALSYYTWNEVSRNISAAVSAGLPAGFDYSPWMPDGEIASAGRTDPNSPVYPRTYAGLDQVSPDWPKTRVVAGEILPCEFLATAIHMPSVWDVWITKATWDPSMPLTWDQMEFLERPAPTLNGQVFSFNVAIPNDRSGHHVLWVAWQRDDPVGEVFVTASDLEILKYPGSGEDFEISTAVNGVPTSLPDTKTATVGDTLSVRFESPDGSYHGTIPSLIASIFPTGMNPISPTGYPEVHLDQFNYVIAFDGLQPPVGSSGPVTLAPGGLTFSYPVWPGYAGFSVIFQAFSLSPSANTGHVITVTDGHEFKII